MEPFIYPHQINAIQRQLIHLLHTVYFVGDHRVYAATRESVVHNIRSLFHPLTPEQAALFTGIEQILGQRERNAWLERLQPYVIPFPEVTAPQLSRMFRKVKKLALPELPVAQRDRLTYLGWRDIATKSMYLVYPYLGELTGIRCTYVAGETNRTATCCICEQSRPGSEVGLVVAVTKAANYMSVGNHMCLNSEQCNQDVTHLDGIHTFFARALG